MATCTIRRLPALGSSQDAAVIAITEPTGAPSSANPSVPSVRPRWALTSGMWAVQDANSSPWMTNTVVTAIRGQRAERLAAVVVCGFGSDTVQRLQGRRRGAVVGDDHVECRQLADHRERPPAEFGAVHGEHAATARGQQRLLDRGVT